MKLFISERPMTFFASLCALLALLSVLLSIPLAITYVQTGLVPRLPTAVLCVGLMICAALSLVCGVILNVVTLGRRETKQLAYLQTPAWQQHRSGSPHP